LHRWVSRGVIADDLAATGHAMKKQAAAPEQTIVGPNPFADGPGHRHACRRDRRLDRVR
jgi:hypothetical protein